MKRAKALRSSLAVGALPRVAVLAAAGAIGVTSSAAAQYYDWHDSEPGYSNQQIIHNQHIIHPSRHQQRARRATSKKEVVKDTTVHPQMPLIINVSIARQRVTVYDANGRFAEAPVSTGMRGHPTPMGVFSVIQKDRYHHSNIYSDAPMPFMQRITWGGVALHAGVLPGYPASHGCIRMPESFAIKMWGWTKLGARVIVTPGELAPSSFSHPLLPTVKVAPQPVVAEQSETDEPVGAKADKGAPQPKPVEANLELRSTVGDEAQPRDQTRTADAGRNMRASTGTMSDAPSTANSPTPDAGTAKTDDAKPGSGSVDAAKTEAASADTAGKHSGSVDTGNAPSSAPSTDANPADLPAAAEPAGDKPTSTDLPADGKPAAAASTPDQSKPDNAMAADRPADSANAANTAGAPMPAADAKKDETRLSDIPPAPKRREGQLAVFISRKDSKLYVRQNLAPWFEVPVTIAPSDRPLGTHVFTAEVDKSDLNILHWTVVSVPMSARAAMREIDEPRASRRQKGKNAEVKAAPVPNSPAEALDRITIPAGVMSRIAEALVSGGSIMVSDQGIKQGETGEYTDFIVRTY